MKIVIEGPRACGKTYLIRHILIPALEKEGRGYKVYDNGRMVNHKDGTMPVSIIEQQTGSYK